MYHWSIEWRGWRLTPKIVKWLHEHRSEGCSAAALNGAVRNDYFDVMLWLHETRGEPIAARTLSEAVSYGDVSMVRWVLDRVHTGFSSRKMRLAAENQHLEVLMTLHTDGRFLPCGAETVGRDQRYEIFQRLLRGYFPRLVAPMRDIGDVYLCDCVVEQEELLQS